jgi:carbon-monoxide dehydrogenase medium subunit/xanthine dehydrogenase FAD-binding subunit
MRPFEYHVPQSLAEACALVSDIGADARILAGGTDVLVEMRKPGAFALKALVDISRIAALRGIEESGDTIIIRPLTTHEQIFHSEIIGQHAPLLRTAVAGIGSPQIRNRGTVGGNIMNAAACADTVPPLIALDAKLKLLSAKGERIVELSEFFEKPYVTVAQKDELLVEIQFPKLPRNARSAFIKLGRRNALSIARLSVAAVLGRTDEGTMNDARIVTGAAFPKWQRVPNAESLLLGQKASRLLFEQAGKKVSDALISYTGRRWSTEYKEPVIAVLVRRALEACQ